MQFKIAIKVFQISFFFIIPSILKGEVLYSNRGVSKSNESSNLLERIQSIPKFSKLVDLTGDLASEKNCSSTLEDVGKMVNGFNGCSGYLSNEENINKSSEAIKTREDYIKELGFKKSDSFIELVKNHEYERAYQFLQIYYDDDVLFKKDKNGDTVFHVLARECQDPQAQKFLLLLFAPGYQTGFIAPLKIKTSEADNKRIQKKCSSMTPEEAMTKIWPQKILPFSNKNGTNVLDSMPNNCQGTLIYQTLSGEFDTHLGEYLSRKDFTPAKLKSLFPDSYENKMALIMSTQPIDKVQNFFGDYNFSNLDFGKYFERFLPKTDEEQYQANNDFIVSKLTLSSIQKAKEGRLDDPTVELLLTAGNFVQKDADGDTLLDSVRKNNQSSKYFPKLQVALNNPVLRAINNEDSSDPYLNEFLKNGDTQKGIGISIPFFKYVGNSKNEEFKKKIFDYYRVSVDSDDGFVNQINELFSKTQEVIAPDQLKSLVHDLCMISEKVNNQIDCEKFEKNMISNIQKYGMNVGFITPVLNLIDQASLYGQTTIAYFLNSLVNRVNPQLAEAIASRKNFTTNIDPALFEKMVPYVLDKINQGDVEYSPDRYRLREFVAKAFQDSIEEKSPIIGLGVIQPAPLNSAHLYGISEKGEPIYIKSMIDNNLRSDGKITLKSLPSTLGNKVVDLVKCNDFSSCSTVAIKLTDLAIGGAENATIKGAKIITSDEDVRSLITSSNLNTCRAVCGSLLFTDIALGSTSEVLSIVNIDGVATKVAKARIASNALIKGTNVFESIEGFFIESEEDFVRANECSTNCIVQDTFNKVADKEKLIKIKKDAITFLDSKSMKMAQLQKSLDSIRALAGNNATNLGMRDLIGALNNEVKSSIIPQFQNYVEKFNISSSIIMNSKDSKTIQNEELNIALAENSLMNKIISLGNSYSQRIYQLNRVIAREEAMNSRGDPTGAGGHGRPIGPPPTTIPSIPDPVSTPVAGPSPSVPSSTSPSGLNISIPTW